MFDDLLSFHRPAWVEGAEYYARDILHLYQLGLLKGPRYPEGWFARKWEDVAISIIIDLHSQHGEVTTETFTAALRQATEQAEGAYS